MLSTPDSLFDWVNSDELRTLVSEADVYDELTETDDCSDSDGFRVPSPSENLELILSPADFDTLDELDAWAGREEVEKLVLYAAVLDVAETDECSDCDGSKAANTPRILEATLSPSVFGV